MYDFHHKHNLFYERGQLVEAIRQHMLSLIAISVLCGIILLFFRGSCHASIMKMIVGVLVTLSLLKPFTRGHELKLDHFWNSISFDSRLAVQQGIEAAESANAAYIKEAMESYISNKADAMNASIDTEVTLGNDTLQTPKNITIEGNVSPYVKRQLMEIISTDLGITEDRQTWTLQN